MSNPTELPDLDACPFCGGPARVESSAMWLDLVCDHDKACILDGDSAEMSYQHAAESLEAMVAKWNRRAQPESEAPQWGRVQTVRDMVRNLLTLDQADPIHSAFFLDFDGKRRCRTKSISISRERVIDGKWVDSTRKDVPYATVVWAKPDERAQQAAAPGALEAWFDAEQKRLDAVSAYNAAVLVSEREIWPGRDTNPEFQAMSAAQNADFHARGALFASRAAPSAPGTPEAPQTAAARDVLAERLRQVEVEGWTPARDDEYVDGQLASAAVAYAQAYTPYLVPSSWPWAVEWFKPADDRRNLVKAGALIVAEIERLDRAAQLDGGQEGSAT